MSSLSSVNPVPSGIAVPGSRGWPWLLPLALALVAVAVPLLIGGSLSPSSTFFNQVSATLGWGIALVAWHLAPVSAAGPSAPAVSGKALACLVGGVAVAMLAMLASAAPWGQRLGPLWCLALVVAVASAAAHPLPRAGVIGPAVLLALLAAAACSVIVGLVQVFTPDWADGWFISNRTAEGLAIGNLRQPNQLSTLLLWGCAAAVWWAVTRRWPLLLLAAVLAPLVFTVVLTASRTGVIGIAMLALWGLVDRRLPGRVRLLLLASPLFYALAWWGMQQWAAAGHAFQGGQRMTATMHGYGSDSRVTTWLNTLELIRLHPWAGVGTGNYNFAWTMTPFPGRSNAFFDHSHDLPLQLAVEFGVPAALLVLGLLLASLWLGRAGLTAADDTQAVSARTALFMLAVVGVHSLLEYPLWYTYFLLPTAALWGWYCGLAQTARQAGPTRDAATPAITSSAAETPAAGSSTPAPAGPAGRAGRMLSPAIAAFGALTIAASLYAISDFWRVATIFETEIWGGDAPLAQRIERGRRCLLFGHHADYARVTMAERPQEVFESFERPLFHLVDTRLMTAYAKALAGRGELQKARHVAARLREFRKPEADEFFAECAKRPDAFQCGPDPKLRYEELLPPSRSSGR
jgi:O-antigen ligase